MCFAGNTDLGLSNYYNSDIATAAAWLRDFLEPKLRNPAFADNTLVVIVWDEGSGPGAQRSHVSTILLSSSIFAGARDATAYDHYSLLRTIQHNWNLGTLGRKDDAARSFGIIAGKPKR